MKRRLTGEEREIHKQAVSIRKAITATPDKLLVEWSKTAKEYTTSSAGGMRRTHTGKQNRVPICVGRNHGFVCR